jgi:hypothetical protein
MKQYDVAVCGGGFAGISAALAAAREGKSVILFEREYMLGGLGTAGAAVGGLTTATVGASAAEGVSSAVGGLMAAVGGLMAAVGGLMAAVGGLMAAVGGLIAVPVAAPGRGGSLTVALTSPAVGGRREGAAPGGGGGVNRGGRFSFTV